LSVEQLGALSNLFFSSVVLSSGFSLISIYFGEYLLMKFNIEKRFPKIAKYINLRRKFQRYYIKLSFFYIVLCSIVQIALALFTIAI
jgi:hypothetical protein